MKALVGSFNQEKALVGAFSVIVQPVVEPMDSFTALVSILARQPIRGQYYLALAEGLEAAGPLCGVCGVDPLPVHRVEAGRVGEGVEVTPSL